MPGRRSAIAYRKFLEDANIKVGSVLSDLFGVSGTRILKALLAGRSFTLEELEAMVHWKVRPKLPELVQSLEGQFSAHHRFLLNTILEHLGSVESCMTKVEAQIESLLASYEKQVERLDTIPGISRDTAAVLVAELGVDMSKFPSADHLASWAGVSPGNHESAGKKKYPHDQRGPSVKNRIV